MKLHRKMKNMVFRAQELGPDAQGEGDKRFKGQIVPPNRVSATIYKLLKQLK